jgi:hypothetical protein
MILAFGNEIVSSGWKNMKQLVEDLKRQSADDVGW